MAAGRKTGGRRAGTPNKATAERAAALQEAVTSLAAVLTQEELARISPKDVMLRVMRLALGAGEVQLALTAAKEAAPYVHQKLSSVEMNATLSRDPREMTDDELASLISGEGDTEAADGSEEFGGVCH